MDIVSKPTMSLKKMVTQSKDSGSTGRPSLRAADTCKAMEQPCVGLQVADMNSNHVVPHIMMCTALDSPAWSRFQHHELLTDH